MQQHKSLFWLLAVSICIFSLFSVDAFSQKRTKKKVVKTTKQSKEKTPATSQEDPTQQNPPSLDVPTLVSDPIFRSDDVPYEGQGTGTGTGGGSGSPKTNVENTENKNESASTETKKESTSIKPVGKIYRIWEVTEVARVVSKPAASYTDEARENQIQGTVKLKAVFTADGAVINIKVVKGLPYGLSKKAMEAASKITFIPALKNGKSVSQYVELEFSFRVY